jgi:hypothetical protein
MVGTLTALAVLGGACVASAASPPPQACNDISNINAVSGAQLQLCNLTQVPLANTTSLPGGGVAYNYTLPDGQVYSINRPPSGFSALTASAAEDSAYGIPPAPAPSAPGYADWQKLASSPWGAVSALPDLVVGTNSANTSPGDINPLYTPASSPDWAGYTQDGSGWTENEVVYAEPTFGTTNCVFPPPAVSFFAGIGNQQFAIAQDGTASGDGIPLHSAFLEAEPGLPAYPGPKATAGSFTVANVQYLGSGHYTDYMYINGANYSYGSTGGYDGSVVEDIVERPQISPNNYTTLLNFQAIGIIGFTGVTGAPIAPTRQWNMTGFATTGPAAGGVFEVEQNHCGG